MIGIQLDGERDFLETLPDTKISMQLENPLLADGDKLSPGSFSLPFSLPGGNKSPGNAARLRNPDVIENNEAYQVQKAMLFYDGLPLKKGTLKASRSEGDEISANFLFGLSQVGDDFKTARLRDAISENIVIDASAITKKIYLKRTTGGNYNVTINGKNYDESDIDSLRIAINTDAEATLDTGVYVPWAQIITSGNSPSGLITPDYLEIKLRLYYTFYDDVLEMEFQLWQDSTDPHQELSVSTDSPEDYQVESFDMDAYYDAFDTFLSGYLSGSYPTDKIRFPVFFNANAYNDQPIKNGEVINAVNASGIIRNEANWGLLNSKPEQVRNYNSIQPFLRLRWVLDRLGELFNFTLEGDFYDLTEDMLLDNSVMLDLPQAYIGETPFVFWRRSFNLNELVPDIAVTDIFLALKLRYNVGIYFDEVTRKVRMQLREVIALSNVYEDITPYASPVKPIVDSRHTGFTIKILKEDSDKLSVEETVTVGTPDKTITIPMGRLHGSSATVIDGVALTGPRVSRNIDEKFGLRVFHYRGVVDGGAFNYPAASISSDTLYEPLADFVLQQGIYSRFHKYWLLFQRNRRTVQIDSDFPLRKIRNLNWELKYRYDRTNYLIKSIHLTLTNDDMEVNKVELITMN